MTHYTRLILLILSLVSILSPTLGNDSGFLNVAVENLGGYDLEKFEYDGGEKARVVVEMAKILSEEKNAFDVYSALQAGRGRSLLLSFEFNELDTLLYNRNSVEEKYGAYDDYCADQGQYSTTLFGETLFTNFQDGDFVIKSSIHCIELNNLSLNEKEVVVYCTNGYVQYLIVRDDKNAERFLYKEARVVKYESNEGLVVRFNDRGRLDRAAPCRYPVAPNGRVRFGSADSVGETTKVIVDHTFEPETLVEQVAIFEGAEVRVAPLAEPLPYADFDSCR